MKIGRTFIITLLLSIFTVSLTHAQMKRERVNPDGAVDEIFWAPNIVGLSTVDNLPAQNLNVTIMHSFGILSNDTFQNFFGLDVPPNVRLGLDYGVTDRWSVGIGRTTFDKIIDVRTKYSLMRQTESGSKPLSISIKADVGLTTQENGRPLGDDLNFLVSLPVGKKFNEPLSLQLAPIFAHFNTVNKLIGQRKDHFAVAVGGEYQISRRIALNAEYYPVIGKRSTGTNNAFALGLNIETGGHVFQLFLASSNWHTEQHIISRNTDKFWAGDFRFGFNVNRLFFLGEEQ